MTFGFRYGKILIELYSSFKGANAEIRERIIAVEASWNRTRLRINIIERIRDTLDERHRRVQDDILQILFTKLLAANQQASRVVREGSAKKDGKEARKWKYPLVKESIDKAIKELDNWQKMYDPSWFLILRMATPVIDEALDNDLDSTTERSNPIATARNMREAMLAFPQSVSSIFLDQASLDRAHRKNIPYSSAELAFRPLTHHSYFIIDSIPSRQGILPELLTRDVRELARRLSAADPWTFGLLPCYGVVKVYDQDTENCHGVRLSPASFDFVFSVPPELKSPRSLRDILLRPDQTISLSVRFRIAW